MPHARVARAELLACVDIKGRTALHLACQNEGCSEVLHETYEVMALQLVALLLAHGADPQAVQPLQPIHYAARWSVPIVERLVAAGAKINAVSFGLRPTTPLGEAFGGMQAMRMIPQLVALGARMTVGDERGIALACELMRRRDLSQDELAAILTTLATAGVSLSAYNFNWKSPLDIAAGYGNLPALRALLALGVKATNWNAFYARNLEVVHLLVKEAGAPRDSVRRFKSMRTTRELPKRFR